MTRARKTDRVPTLALLLAALLVAGVTAPLAAGDWSGTIGAAFLAQSEDGSRDSFRSQLNLDQGFVLDEVSLAYRQEEAAKPRFTVTARGFGNAEPAQSARLTLALDSPWRFSLDYDRRESFFAVADSEWGRRADDWRIARWRGSVVWDGWKAARVALDLRHHERSGTVMRPLYGLNELYPLQVDLDETMQEAALRIETRTLPVHLVFEQAFATYERNDGRRPAGSRDLLTGTDPDLFVIATDRRKESRDVPTSRLVATWASPRVEVAGSLLWSPAELDGPGEVSEGFDIAGGQVGRVEFIDDIVSSAQMDTLAGNLRLGFALSRSFTLRLESDYRDTSTDATLRGQRILRITDPFGMPFDLGAGIDETSRIDVTDRNERLILEWSDRGWRIWGGAFTASRDVAWEIGTDGEAVAVTRDSDGGVAGVGWSRGKLRGSAEYERGSFNRYVFRTDPETVDRLTLRLSADLGGGWRLRGQGRFESADNPRQIAGLDSSSAAYGVGLGWTAPSDGETGFGFDVDRADLTTDTDLVLPGGAASVSRYDLALTTVTAHGRAKLGRARLSGALTRLDDAGETWPVQSWIGRARIGFDLTSALEVALLGEYWSYDEERANGDDYDVSRYGLALRWRFQ